MKKTIYAFVLFVIVSGCDLGIDTYEIHDVSKKQIFRPEIRELFLTDRTDSYSIHVEGTLDGDAEIYVLSPNADIHKLRSCTPYDNTKMKKGKVDVIFNRSGSYKSGEKPYLYYLPCTAKKGYLKVRISFTEYLKGNGKNTQFL
ncbi:MAG TPA: hypothetical protein DCM71_19160 [Runella sp.]|nr:hypothetical protein [Runella sp.]